MSLLPKINGDLTAAMRSKDQLRLDTLRAVKAAIERWRVDHGGTPATDEQEITILGTLSKQRREAATAFRSGNRLELASKEDAELAVIQEYMPQDATVDEIEIAIRAVYGDVASLKLVEMLSPKDMGALMKAVPAKLPGKRVDGKHLSIRVKAILELPAVEYVTWRFGIKEGD